MVLVVANYGMKVVVAIVRHRYRPASDPFIASTLPRSSLVAHCIYRQCHRIRAERDNMAKCDVERRVGPRYRQLGLQRHISISRLM